MRQRFTARTADMTVQEHLQALARLERIGHALTVLCICPLVLVIPFYRADDMSKVGLCFLIFLVLHFINIELLRRGCRHRDHLGRKLGKELNRAEHDTHQHRRRTYQPR